MNTEPTLNEVDAGMAIVKPQRSTSLLVRSKIKSYALDVATRKRPANNFRRVSESFCIAVEAAFDARIRAIQLENTVGEGEQSLVTGYAVQSARRKLNQAAVAIIHGMVMKHPSVGVTLSA